MGIVNRLWLEEQEKGYSSNYDKTVCIDCFDEYGLKNYIKEHQTHSSCSYCKTNNNDIVACTLDSLIEYILASMHHEWGYPAEEGLPYESREGGWQFSTVYDTQYLLDIIGLKHSHVDTYKDICNSIHNQKWCEKGPYSLRADETLLIGWEKFCAFLKNQVRYVFFKTKNGEYDQHQHDEMDPVSILDAIEKIINEIGLVKVIDTETQIYRVRIVDEDENLTTSKELGSPPLEFANLTNRMSPAGIPMFYGAFEIETAIKETYEPCDTNKKAISGVFQPIKPLFIIDLSEELFIPSLFDEHKRENRNYIKFLIDFLSDFTKPIERSDRSHIDYVPTQVVTEYIRHIFKSKYGDKIDGVIYPSSKNRGKSAIVIFADSAQCVESVESSKNGAILKLVNVEKYSLNEFNK